MAKYEYLIIAKENLQLPGKPNIYWIKGKTYKLEYDTINGVHNLASENGFQSFYTANEFENIEMSFDIDIMKKSQGNNREAIERLRNGICVIAGELNIDRDLTKGCIKNMNKDELIEKFIELKELRLKKENSRIIDLLL
jgi:hypothetical protein